MSSLPQEFLDKLPSFVPSHILPEVLASFEQKLPPSIRINTLKATVEDCTHQLETLGFTLSPTPWQPNAFVIVNKTTRDLTNTDLYKSGQFYIQNLSSMLPAMVLNPQPNDKVLDITAAPGSKTTQIAALMKNTGEIIANDISRTRTFTLNRALQTYGVTNTQTVVSPAQNIWERFPEYFDKTLVDAPCSMEGRFLNSDPKTFMHWSPRKVKELAVRQQYILRSAVTATKVGGIIVYSTCTLSPEENEHVIEKIMEREKGALELQEILIPNLNLDPGLIPNTARIYPRGAMEGFFIAKLKKIKSNL